MHQLALQKQQQTTAAITSAKAKASATGIDSQTKSSELFCILHLPFHYINKCYYYNNNNNTHLVASFPGQPG